MNSCELPRSGPPAGWKRPKRAGIILVCAALLGGAWFLFQRQATGEPSKARQTSAPPALPIASAAARSGDIGVYVNALGAVTPIRTVAVKSRVDGQLMTVDYTEGQMVREGAPLLEIDPKPYQAQLTQAQGQYARDKALLDNARIDLDRYQVAYASNAVPQQTLATQAATVRQYEGTVKFDQGQMDSAQVLLDYCHIVSPVTGRVGLRLVDPGNIVHASDTAPLVVITQLRPITVIFSVAEDYLPEIQKQLGQGQTLTVEAYDRAQQTKLATGTLLTLDNQIDPGTGTVKLKAIFTNEDDSLFPNQFVNARLRVDTQRAAILVPITAIQRNGQSAFVYVVRPDQTVAMHPVSVGIMDGPVAAVDGLDAGEVIAMDNFNRLQDGMKVAVSQDPGRKAGAGRPVQKNEL